MKRLLWCLSLACTALPAQAQDGRGPQPGDSWLARVSYVVDGDSIWVRPTGGGARVKLRLHGIDAPEICQSGGAQARDALRTLVQGHTVRVSVQARDRYGRAIAQLQRVSDGQDVPARMVSEGWAWSEHYSWGKRSPGVYGSQQAEAQAAARGIFAQPGAEHPADFRRRHGPCPSASRRSSLP